MISGFQNTYRFLSNFYQINVCYKGVVYDNAESAYQAQKCKKKEDKLRFIGLTGAEAKKLSKEIECIDGWDSVKRQIMFEIVLQKFLQNPSIAERLIDTKNEILVETNYWHDNCWGNCECENCAEVHGDNNLGLILMNVRYILTTLHPKPDYVTAHTVPENDRMRCPVATPFATPRCMAYDRNTGMCTGLCKCNRSPYFN